MYLRYRYLPAVIGGLTFQSDILLDELMVLAGLESDKDIPINRLHQNILQRLDLSSPKVFLQG